ncbi:hypothetical protein D3C75_1285890 [compost metagenome]
MIAMVTGPGRAKVRLSRALLWPRSSMITLMYALPGWAGAANAAPLNRYSRVHNR